MHKFILVLLVIVCFLRRSDGKESATLFLKNGEEVFGELKEIKRDTIILSTQEGEVRFLQDEVASIWFEKEREGSEWKTLKDVTDTTLISSWNKTKNIESLYPKAGYVNALIHKKVSFEKKEVKEEFRTILKILKERGKYKANNLYPFLQGIEDCELCFARSITADGKVHSIHERAIEDIPVYPEPPFYSRFMLKKFAIPEGKIGAILDFKIKVKRESESILNPFLFDFTFSEKEPTLLGIVEIEFPKGEEIVWFTSDGSKPAKKMAKEDKIVLRWEYKNLEGLKDEPNSPPPQYIRPRIMAARKTSWINISQAYRTVLKDSMKGIEKLSSILDSLLSTSTTRIDTLKALYYFTLESIHYVPIDADEYSYIPSSVEAIWDRRFANTVDKTFFFYALLKKVNFSPHFILTPSKNKTKFVEEIPSLGQFSKAILRIDDTLFLNPTKDMEFGYIEPSIQGMQALDTEEGKIVKLPQFKPFKEKTTINIIAKFQKDGTLEIEEERIIRGKDALDMRDMKNWKEKEIHQWAEKEVKKVCPSSILEEFLLENLMDYDKPIIVKLKYKAPEYGLKAGDFFIFKIPGITYSAEEVGRKERENPMLWERKKLLQHTITIHLPPGYKLYHLPEDLHLSNKYVSYDANFIPFERKIEFYDCFERNGTWIPPKDYKLYKEVIENMAEISKELVVLKAES